MTVKQFFKSKTFRCIVVLLCIALVAGALLSIMNDLLYVSDTERVQRTIKSIYGQAVEYQEVPTDFATDSGKIEAAYYLVEDGNYLLKVTGYHGYKEGSVTIWCVARYQDGQFVSLGDVSIASYEKQTLMGMFGSANLKAYAGTEAMAETEGVVSGATYSSAAIRNAFNTALAYIEQVEVEE